MLGGPETSNREIGREYLMGQRSSFRVVSAEIHRDGKYLISQRLPQAVLPLLWEFPGGRVREGQEDGDVLREKLMSRLGVEITVGELVLEVTHAYDGYDLVLRVYRCTLGEGEPSAVRVNAVEWVAPEELRQYSFPGADQKTVDLLLKGE